MKTCPICEKGKLIKNVVPYFVYGIEIGRFPAEICTECKEEWFDEKTAKKIEQIEKKKGLFGLAIQSRISYSGNSLIVRIPAKLVKFMKLEKEKQVLIHPEV